MVVLLQLATVSDASHVGGSGEHGNGVGESVGGRVGCLVGTGVGAVGAMVGAPVSVHVPHLIRQISATVGSLPEIKARLASKR